MIEKYNERTADSSEEGTPPGSLLEESAGASQ
jgi:hypothetical protein